MARAVAEWLSSLSLSHYTESFVENGYDDMTMCQELNEEDIDAIGVVSVNDRQAILAASLKLQEDAALRSNYFELQPEAEAPETTSENARSVYMELEAERTVKIPKMKLKIMIRDEMKTDDVNLAEEPYSNPDGTPGESLNDLIEVYALQFNTPEEDVRSCVEALRKSIFSSRSSSVSSQTSQSMSPIQKEPPKRPQPPKPMRIFADSDSETGSKKPPPKPLSAPSIGSNNSTVNKPPTKPQRTQPSGNLGNYINFDELESSLSERKKSQSDKDKVPEATPRKLSLEEQGTKVVPQRPKVKPVVRNPTQDVEHANKKEDSEKKMKRTDHEVDTYEAESTKAARKEMADVSQGDSKLSSVKQSVTKGFQELKSKLRKIKSTPTISSASESPSPSPTVSPPPTNVPPVTDIGGLVAKDITMSDDDRLKLMQMVKEGKYSIDEALSQIQQYEEEKLSKADKDKEPVIRKAVVEERDDSPVEKSQEQMIGPPPKPTRPAVFTQFAEEEVAGMTRDEGTVLPLSAPRPVAPPRRNRPVVVPRSEDEPQAQVTVNEGKDKEGDREIEEEVGAAEVKPVKSKLKDMKLMLSGIMHGKKEPRHAVHTEKTVDETGEEHDTPKVTVKTDQAAEGEEVGGKSGKKRFFKNVLGMRKKDKSKKEQTADDLAMSEDDATIDETTDESREPMAVKGSDETADDDKPKRSLTFIGGSLNKLKDKFTKKRRHESVIETSETKSLQSEASAGAGASVPLNAAVSRESISSLASGGSHESSTTTAESSSIHMGPVIGKARVIQSFVPSAYDPESLTLKVGDFINVISKPDDGLWTGELNGRIGQFKFIYVEMLEDEPDPLADMACSSPGTQQKTILQLPSTVNEFLVKLGLQDRQEQFVLNGYDSMDVIKKIDRAALDELGITEAQQRKAALTLVKQLSDASSIATSSQKKLAPMPPGTRKSPAPAPPRSKRPAPPSKLILAETEGPAGDEAKSKKPAPHPPAGKPVKRPNSETEASSVAGSKPLLNPTSLPSKSGDGEADVKLSPRPAARRLPPQAPGTKGSVSDASWKPIAGSHVQPEPSVGDSVVKPMPRKRIGTSAKSLVNANPKPQPRHRSATVVTKPSVRERASPVCEEKQPISNNVQLRAEVAKPALPPQKPAKPAPFAGSTRPSSVAVPSAVRGPLDKPPLIPATRRAPPTKPAALSTQVKHHADAPKPTQTTQTTPHTSNEVSASDSSRPVAPSRRHRKPVDCPTNPNIVKKLESDRIDLTEAPYSAEDGACGIPVGLIHRYAEELRLSPKDIAMNLEKLRSNELKVAGRQVVPMDPSLSEKDWTDSIETLSVDSLLLSIGLPFLIDCFSCKVTDITKMSDISNEQLLELGVKDPRHLKRIQRALAILKERT